MAKVKSIKPKGLSSWLPATPIWLPDTPMYELIVWCYCPEHGVYDSGFFGTPCSRHKCSLSFEIGKTKDLTDLDKLLYGIEDV